METASLHSQSTFMSEKGTPTSYTTRQSRTRRFIIRVCGPTSSLSQMLENNNQRSLRCRSTISAEKQHDTVFDQIYGAFPMASLGAGR